VDEWKPLIRGGQDPAAARGETSGDRVHQGMVRSNLARHVIQHRTHVEPRFLRLRAAYRSEQYLPGSDYSLTLRAISARPASKAAKKALADEWNNFVASYDPATFDPNDPKAQPKAEGSLRHRLEVGSTTNQNQDGGKCYIGRLAITNRIRASV